MRALKLAAAVLALSISAGCTEEPSVAQEKVAHPVAAAALRAPLQPGASGRETSQRKPALKPSGPMTRSEPGEDSANDSAKIAERSAELEPGKPNAAALPGCFMEPDGNILMELLKHDELPSAFGEALDTSRRSHTPRAMSTR